MNATLRMTGVAMGMLAALVVVSAAQAQSHPATTVPAKAPTPLSAPASAAAGPDALFTRWDTNHDKMLSAEEFRAGWRELQTTMALRRLHEQFTAMDTNRNGCLNASEYANLELIKHAGTSAPPMSMFDTEKNQCLDFKEYVNVVNYMLKQEHK
jgi:hypothetical protein